MAGLLIAPGAWPVQDSNGDPVSGASISFFQPGTTTPKPVYSDNTLATSLGTVLTTNAGGEPTTLAGVVAREWWSNDGESFDIRIEASGLDRTWQDLPVISGSEVSAETAVYTPEQFGALVDPKDPSTDDATQQAARIVANDAAFAALNVAIGNVGSASTLRGIPRAVLFSPGGIYRTSQTVKIENSYVKVFGQGAGIRCTGNVPVFQGDYASSVNNNMGLEVHDLMVMGTSSSSCHAFLFKSCPQLLVKNCGVKNFDDLTGETSTSVGGTAYFVQGCVSYELNSCSFDKVGQQGIHVKTLNKILPSGGGTISTSTANTALTGVGTLFSTYLFVGANIYSSAGVYLGTVQSITDNLNAVLTANAAATVVTNTGWYPTVWAESQGGVIAFCRGFKAAGIACLISEGGGHKVIYSDFEDNTGGGIEIRSSYDFSITDCYFESNSVDVSVRNLTDLVAARVLTGGRITSCQMESATGISLTNGDDIIVDMNRISGNVSIAAAVNRTVWRRQVELTGSFTNSSTTTIREDLAPTGPTPGVLVTRGNTAEYILGRIAPTGTTASPADLNIIFAVPVVLDTTRTITRIGVRTGTFTSAINARLAIYTNSNGQPGTKLAEGEVSLAAATTNYEVTISQSLTAGVQYWIVCCFSNSTVQLLYSSSSGIVGVLPYNSTLTSVHSLQRAFTYGALPADESGQTYTQKTNGAPLAWLRVV
jgi:hypothetical protein